MEILKLHRFLETFTKESFAQKMEFLFWQVLCPYPDQTRIGMWWYGVSGRISGRFHKIHCRQCGKA